MIGLPAALAPWGEELARLPVDLALAIAPWVGRLSLAIGPMAEARHARSGEPDGFTGLARRGSYERLITTEWAVAELYPDEFARRAAAGEHMFLELARRGHHAARWTVAVVSAGPEQLGAPRLAHLAMLIVLARRAAAAGATFSWGVLEDRPRLALIDDVNAVAVRRLLDARTADAGGAEAVAAWRDALHGDADVEIWWIGGATDLETARAAGDPCVIVHDVLEPGVRALDVEVARRGKPARVRLALPPADDCARLLREPMPRPAASFGRTARMGGRALAVRWGSGARRMMIQLAGGRVESWPVPNSPRATIGKSRRWTYAADQDRLLALGGEERAILGAVIARRDPATIRFAQAGELERVGIDLSIDPRRFEDGRVLFELPGRCVLFRQPGKGPRLVLAYAGGLFAVDAPLTSAVRAYTTSAKHMTGSSVLAVSLSSSMMQWIEQRADGVVMLREEDQQASRGKELSVPAGVDGQPVRASFGFDTSGDPGALAVVSWSEVACTVVSRTRAPQHLVVDEPVIGVARWTDGEPALLVQQNARHLAWRRGKDHIPIATPSDDIVAVEVCTAKPYVAWVTSAGEVVVYSARHGAALLHLVPGAEETAP